MDSDSRPRNPNGGRLEPGDKMLDRGGKGVFRFESPHGNEKTED
jgi:hypothetical protein